MAVAGRDLLDSLFCGLWPGSPTEVTEDGQASPFAQQDPHLQTHQSFLQVDVQQSPLPGLLPVYSFSLHWTVCWVRLGVDLVLCGREVTSHYPATSREPTQFCGPCLWVV